jgi:hypothetical protein
VHVARVYRGQRWTPGDERPEILREKLVWRAGGEPFELDVAAFFTMVLGEP